jgi:hypothetical protein
VGAPELTETTVRYLFAAEWLPSDTTEIKVPVPGGSTKAIDTAGNLLHIAMWNLRRQGLMDFEQLRPFEEEYIRAFGGSSFSRYSVLHGSPSLPGLEGALLRAAADLEEPDNVFDRAFQRLADEDTRGVRRLVRALDLDNKRPWSTVCNKCFTEAHTAGLVEVKGSRLFGQQVVITDQAAVEALRERHDELRAARGAYLDAEPELTEAVIGDCLRTVIDAYSPHLGD